MSVRSKKRRAGHASASHTGFPELFFARVDEGTRAYWRRAWSNDVGVRAVLTHIGTRLAAIVGPGGRADADPELPDLVRQLGEAGTRYSVRTGDKPSPAHASKEG